jgi:hypothetical protein
VAKTELAIDSGISPDLRDTSAKGSPLMVIVIYAILLLGCSVTLSAVAFLVGRCGRKLPIDDVLPRVVHSARFDADDDRPCTVSGSPGPRWPRAS